MSSGGSSSGTGTPGAGCRHRREERRRCSPQTPIKFLASGSGDRSGRRYPASTARSIRVEPASALTTTSNGVTTFDGALGSSSRLAALTTTAVGTTVVNGGSVLSTGAQTFASPVDARARTPPSTPARRRSSSTARSTARTSSTRARPAPSPSAGAVGAVTPLTRLVGTAQTLTIADATINGGSGSAIDLTGTRNIVGTGALTSNGAPITLAGNAAGGSAGTFVGRRPHRRDPRRRRRQHLDHRHRRQRRRQRPRHPAHEQQPAHKRQRQHHPPGHGWRDER
jgi:hypothetical protein